MEASPGAFEKQSRDREGAVKSPGMRRPFKIGSSADAFCHLSIIHLSDGRLFAVYTPILLNFPIKTRFLARNTASFTYLLTYTQKMCGEAGPTSKAVARREGTEPRA
jgi:hypothetical protein